MKTRDRILLKSLELFNLQGERAVTTNHIAAELGISPGNLYYHFANKEAIIYQLFRRYSDDMLQTVTAPVQQVLTQELKVALFENILGCMWRYRFLHRDLAHMVGDSDELRLAYRAFAHQLMVSAQAIYRYQAAHGQLQASEDEIASLVVNLWIIATSWVNFLSTTGFFGFQEPLTEDQLRQGLYQILCLEEPYLSGQAKAEIAAIKARYGHALRLPN